MSVKWRALGFSLLTLSLGSAFGAMSAPAETGGHFSSDAAGGWTHILGTQIGAAGTNEFYDTGLETGVTCSEGFLTGNTDAATETDIVLEPIFAKCHPTVGGTAENFTPNSCIFRVTIGKSPRTTDQTVHFSCVGTKKAVLFVDPPIVGTCTYTIPAQTPKGGAVYVTGLKNGKHDLTASFTLTEMTNTKTETGFGCYGIAGENTELDIITTMTLTGQDTQGNAVNITATGPNGEE